MFQSLLGIHTMDHFRGNVGRFSRILCRPANCYNLVDVKKRQRLHFGIFFTWAPVSQVQKRFNFAQQSS